MHRFDGGGWYPRAGSPAAVRGNAPPTGLLNGDYMGDSDSEDDDEYDSMTTDEDDGGALAAYFGYPGLAMGMDNEEDDSEEDYSNDEVVSDAEDDYDSIEEEERRAEAYYGNDFPSSVTDSEDSHGARLSPEVDAVFEDEHGDLSGWYCSNCTEPNVEAAEECTFCGKQRGELVLPPDSLGERHPQLRPTVVGYDMRMLLHTEGKSEPHPERPDRLAVLIDMLKQERLLPGRCRTVPSREIRMGEVALAHSVQHFYRVEATSTAELTYFTPDTYANAYSAQAARLAAGTTVDVVKEVVSGKAANGLALVRPPGHHAESAAIMGFCLHNNVAIAAKVAQENGAKKVLIIDWDVHHGNGTQEIFDSDPTVLYVSLHRHDGGMFYPGTGAADEIGTGPGRGYSVNIPWPCGGMGDAEYITAFCRVILPIAYQFVPDVVLVSAGFDAAAGDRIGGCSVTPAGYAHMTALLKPLAAGKTVIVLEGGYNLRSLAASVAACTKTLLGDPLPPLTLAEPHRASNVAITQAVIALLPYWRFLGARMTTPAPIRSRTQGFAHVQASAEQPAGTSAEPRSPLKENGMHVKMPVPSETPAHIVGAGANEVEWPAMFPTWQFCRKSHLLTALSEFA
eukprot:jgi/Chlat1/4283/Chrsp29S04376